MALTLPFRVVEMEFPADVHDCDGWLHHRDHGMAPMRIIPFIAPLEDFIRRAYAEACADGGHLFWPPDHRPGAGRQGRTVRGWSVGPTTMISAAKTALTMNAWHRDQVTQRPEAAKVLACNDFCENAALIYDDRILTRSGTSRVPPGICGRADEDPGQGFVPDDLMAAAEGAA
jgi:hypothetical protein